MRCRSLHPALGKREERAAALRRSAHLRVNVADGLFAVNDHVRSLRRNEKRGDAERVPPPAVRRRVNLKRLVEIAPNQCNVVLGSLESHFSFRHGVPGGAERSLPGIVELRLDDGIGPRRKAGVDRRRDFLRKKVVQLSVVDKYKAQVTGRLSVTRGDKGDVPRPGGGPDQAPIADGRENLAAFFIEQTYARVLARNVNLANLNALLNCYGLCRREAR